MQVRLSLWVTVGALVLAGCGDDPSTDGGNAGSAGVSGSAGQSAGGVGGVAGAGGSSAGSGGAAGGNSAGSGGSGAAAGSGGSSGAASGGTAGSTGGTGGTGDVPLPGFGTISGDCGPIDSEEILSPDPFSFETHLDFGMDAFSYDLLSTGGKYVYDAGNLGGNSLYSEVFSYEVLYRCELATLLKTETEIVYQDPGGKKTDILVEIDGYKVGVSVTRAFAFPAGSTYSEADALSLLQKKLGDIPLSSANAAPADHWQKQILHILAYNDQHRDAVFQAYSTLDSTYKADTLVYVTVTDGADDFMY
ncbi:MAG: hypothetical protein H6718_35050 [Polyangiaceae bacterium]|nr:hypothetical protein [Myxococcales bacterium]MCB9590678.1 hypothetical protein [Polyangiaceae bacterium]